MIRPQWEWALDDAEQWLGEHWRALAEAGAVQARLLHDGTQAAPGVELRVP